MESLEFFSQHIAAILVSLVAFGILFLRIWGQPVLSKLAKTIFNLSFATFVVIAGAMFLASCSTLKNQSSAQTLAEISAGFQTAEIAYQTLCSQATPPKFCTDPNSVKAYQDAIIAVNAALSAAQQVEANNAVQTK